MKLAGSVAAPVPVSVRKRMVRLCIGSGRRAVQVVTKDARIDTHPVTVRASNGYCPSTPTQSWRHDMQNLLTKSLAATNAVGPTQRGRCRIRSQPQPASHYRHPAISC